jgi:Ammonium Transporter Family
MIGDSVPRLVSLTRKTVACSFPHFTKHTHTQGMGFNCSSALALEYSGSVAGRVAANTTLSAEAGGLAAMLLHMLLVKWKTGGELSFDLTKAMNGTLASLVAVTAPCGTVEVWAAMVIGAVSGGLYLLGSHVLIRYRLDDVVDGIPVHLVNGAWGMIATGLFSSCTGMREAFRHDDHVGLFYELGEKSTWDATLLTNQMLAVFVIAAWTVITMHKGCFRTNKVEEVVGLDIRYHGTNEEEVEREIERDILRYQESFNRSKDELSVRKNNKKAGGSDSVTMLEGESSHTRTSQHPRKTTPASSPRHADSLSLVSFEISSAHQEIEV